MTVVRSARERVRAELTREIKDVARRHLAEAGSAGLSLRAVARELGVASSALYRYFPSRDALLTALIVDAYHAVADRAETAVAAVPEADRRGRWLAAAHAVRAWAHARPHEYALVYGSPVPGYAAPADTVEPAARLTWLLLGLVRAAWDTGTLADPAGGPELTAAMREEAAGFASRTGLDGLPAEVIVRTATAWTQLFGAVSLEMFGHLKGGFEDDTPFFTASVELMAHEIGLRDETATD